MDLDSHHFYTFSAEKNIVFVFVLAVLGRKFGYFPTTTMGIGSFFSFREYPGCWFPFDVWTLSFPFLPGFHFLCFDRFYGGDD